MLKNKKAIITGSNRGIGKAIATMFAEQGAELILCSRIDGSLVDLKKELKMKFNSKVMDLYFDVGNPISIRDSFKKIHSHTKTIDVLVNNAGVLGDALLRMISLDLINKVFSTNTYGIIYTTQYVTPFMMRNKGGSIINISSIIGVNGNKGQVVYGGSKSAVIGITKSSSKELAEHNIRVNAIAPGFIDTDMVKNLPESIYKERMDSIKMKRIGTPLDIAKSVLFLASDLSEYITGQTIGVDGGMLM